LVPRTNLVESVCSSMLEMVARWKQTCTLPLWMTWWSLCCNNNFIICFKMNKACTWPIDVNLLLCATSYSPNLNKFAKIICNVVFSSLLHSRGIGLEGKTRSMFVKRKLDGNSHKLDKGVYTINIPMTNYPPPSMHQSLDPLCIPLSVPQPMSQPHFWKSVRMTLTLPKWGLGSPLGPLKL
jgi:hypothetical protein